MNPEHFKLFEYRNEPLEVDGEFLAGSKLRIPIVDGIPRFGQTREYANNFALLRERHAQLQLDSVNGTNDRYITILKRTNWPSSYFQGKTVLECGCGAGPDTEVLLKLGANVVAVDLAGVDAARRNVNRHPDATFVQGSILDLPFRKRSFDIVFCHRVLQHTPVPAETLAYILQFVKDEGAVFVHSYANTWFQVLRWKYALLPLTRRLPPQVLYRAIRAYARPAFALTSLTGRTRVGRLINHFFVPLLNHSQHPPFEHASRDFLLEFAIHDTFDALSPRYDRPLPARLMRDIADRTLQRPFEVYEHPTITLLRSTLQ